MEHVLMLGNGFDLYYKLPTKYNNFLQLASFLSEGDVQKYETVGAILNAYTDSRKDSFVAACYCAHQELYEQIPVTPEQVEALQNLTKDNIWFQYLLKSFNKDVGWIDFEQEISHVIRSLHSLLTTLKLSNFMFSPPSDQFTDHVIQNLRLPLYRPHAVTKIERYWLDPDYTVEYPTGSRHFIPDSNNIMSVLSTALCELSEALKLYLSLFAESILNVSGSQSHFERFPPSVASTASLPSTTRKLTNKFTTIVSTISTAAPTVKLFLASTRTNMMRLKVQIPYALPSRNTISA